MCVCLLFVMVEHAICCFNKIIVMINMTNENNIIIIVFLSYRRLHAVVACRCGDQTITAAARYVHVLLFTTANISVGVLKKLHIICS